MQKICFNPFQMYRGHFGFDSIQFNAEKFKQNVWFFFDSLSAICLCIVRCKMNVYIFALSATQPNQLMKAYVKSFSLFDINVSIVLPSLAHFIRCMEMRALQLQIFTAFMALNGIQFILKHHFKLAM